jgi:hypothetical protein
MECDRNAIVGHLKLGIKGLQLFTAIWEAESMKECHYPETTRLEED